MNPNKNSSKGTNNYKEYQKLRQIFYKNIIDNIPKNMLPKSSEDIKNGIKATSTKHIKTDFLYTLPR